MIFKCRKIVGFRGFAPYPTGGADSAPPDPLADMGVDGTSTIFRGEGEGQRRSLLRSQSPGLSYGTAMVTQLFPSQLM